MLLLATYPMYALISVVFSWFPSYLEAGLGFSTLTSGVLFGLPSVIGMVFMLGSGWLTDRPLARGGPPASPTAWCPLCLSPPAERCTPCSRWQAARATSPT